MTNKLVVIINILKVSKIKKILLYEMEFLVPNYSCLRNPWLGCYRPQIPILSVLCPQLNLLNPSPPPRTKFVGTPLIGSDRFSPDGRTSDIFRTGPLLVSTANLDVVEGTYVLSMPGKGLGSPCSPITITTEIFGS